MANLFSIILKTFFTGPVIGTSHGLNTVSITFIVTAIIDAVLYGFSLYLSIQTMNELHHQRITVNQEFQSMIKQSLQSNSEVIGVLTRTQTDLYDLIKDLVQNDKSDQSLLQNSLNKLRTLKSIHKYSVMTIRKNINESLQLFPTNFNQSSSSSDSFLFDRVSFYICTCSFLLYIHQILLWVFQYLTWKNSKKYLTYSFILSAIILSQSLGFIYFLQITNTSPFPSPLYIYTWIFLIRSLMSMYHQAFSDYLF